MEDQIPEKSSISLGVILFVILFCAILAGMLLPAFIKFNGHGNGRTKCLAQVRDVGTALQNYAQSVGNGYFPFYVSKEGEKSAGSGGSGGGTMNYSNDGKFGANSLWLLVYNKMTDPDQFTCPFTNFDCTGVNAMTSFDNKPGGKRFCSYGYDPRHRNNDEPSVAILSDIPYYKGDAASGEEGFVSHNHGEKEDDVNGVSMSVYFVRHSVSLETTQYCGYRYGGEGVAENEEVDNIFTNDWNKSELPGRGGTDSFIIR